MRVIVALSIKHIQPFDIDTNVFTNPFVEAATRFIEVKRNEPNVNIGAVIECWEQGNCSPNNPVVRVNSYLALLNAGRPDTAERLRAEVLKLHSLDLANEPLSSVMV